MKIGQRNYLILKEIITHRSTVTGKALETSFGLTRKQLEYGIAGINEYLENQQLPPLQRSKNGKIIVPEEVARQLDLEALNMEKQDAWLSIEERYDIALLMLLCGQPELSLQHFITELKVSKNTVLADLKRLKEQIRPAGLFLTYSREAGYQLAGPEYSLRQQLFTVLHNMISRHGQPALVTAIGQITKSQTEHIRKVMEQIEKELKTSFTDEIMEVNCCFFALLLKRIRSGAVLTELPETLRHVAGTKEYMVLKDCLAAEGINNTNETVYWTAHIQSMKIDADLEAVAGLEEVRRAVAETIANFERIACVSFEEKENMYQLLLNHSVPALYRIRYNFHIGPDISEFVLPAYQEVHDIVKKSVAPLEKLIGMSFPEQELIYITLIFIAQTSRGEKEEKVPRRLRAMVVCQNGIAVSNFLLTSLEQIFPEIDFITCLSVQQFYQTEEPFDLVFTAVPLKTSKKQFLTEPLINQEKKKQLRKKVFDSLKNKEEIEFPQIETIFQIIKKYTNESMFQKLSREIDTYMVQSGMTGSRHKPELKELLTESTIRIINESMGWKEAIEFAAIPLLYKNIIRYQYVETIISDIINHRQMMLVADQVMLAHAASDAGVYDVGLSLLVLPEPLMVNDYMAVKVLFVLAAPDRERHLVALNQLISILEDEEKLEIIKQAKTADEILTLLS